jgi:hypothetical protein
MSEMGHKLLSRGKSGLVRFSSQIGRERQRWQSQRCAKPDLPKFISPA